MYHKLKGDIEFRWSKGAVYPASHSLGYEALDMRMFRA
jgi:hypothetical protein